MTAHHFSEQPRSACLSGLACSARAVPLQGQTVHAAEVRAVR